MKALNPINHLAIKPNILIAQSQILLPNPSTYYIIYTNIKGS